MDIRQLRYFLKVAKALNFSEASRRLSLLRAPSHNKSATYGTRDRLIALRAQRLHEVFLTGAGKRLLPYAQRAVVATESCMDPIQDLKQILTGELNIGVTYSASAPSCRKRSSTS